MTTEAPEDTTTIPQDPEAQAIKNQLDDTPVTDLDLTEGVIDKLRELEINSVGVFYENTANGDAPDLLIKAGMPRDAIDDMLIAIANRRNELEDEMKAKTESSKVPLGIQNPQPSRGADDYRWKVPAVLKGVKLDDQTRSVGVRIPVKGMEGVVGLPIQRAYDTFCGRQVDVAIYEGDNPPLEGVGLTVFYAVGKTTTLSFTANHKFANFTLSFIEDAIDGHLLEEYRKKDVTICVNVRDADEPEEENTNDDEQMPLEEAA